MAVSKGGRLAGFLVLCRLLYFVLDRIKLMKNLLYHVLRPNRALMGQIKTKVDRGLTDFLLHVSRLLEYPDDNHLDFAADCLWLNVPEERWQSTLHQLQQRKEILQDRIFETFNNQFNECFEVELDRKILAVYFSRHGISPARVEVYDLLLNLLDGCLSC